jgi:hypothetical protein
MTHGTSLIIVSAWMMFDCDGWRSRWQAFALVRARMSGGSAVPMSTMLESFMLAVTREVKARGGLADHC